MYDECFLWILNKLSIRPWSIEWTFTNAKERVSFSYRQCSAWSLPRGGAFRLSDLNNLYRAHVEANINWISATACQNLPQVLRSITSCHQKCQLNLFSEREETETKHVQEFQANNHLWFGEKASEADGLPRTSILAEFFFFKSILINQEWALNYWRTVPTFRTKIKQNGKQITNEQKHHLRDDTLAVFSGLVGTQE